MTHDNVTNTYASKAILDALVAELDINGLTLDNFTEELADAQRAGILTEDLLDDYESIGSALLDVAEAEKSLLATQESSLDEIRQATQSIADAWVGSLSYLTAAQKTAYSAGYLDLAGDNEEVSALDAARIAAETAIKTTATKEDYIPIFERYISELEKEVEETTPTDILNELRALKDEVVELRVATVDSNIYA